jgi:hypothetical protein
MVNLIGSDRAPAFDLAHDLPPHVASVLPARLREVRSWWAALSPDAPISRRARTPLLEPDLEEESSLAALEAALIALAERRSGLLSRARSDAGAAGTAAVPGRLLVCELDMSIGGGEAEAASRALFDVDDRPPWDLWLVVWGRTHASRPEEPISGLIAWIPEDWLSLAQAGIDACPSRCLYWADRDGAGPAGSAAASA